MGNHKEEPGPLNRQGARDVPFDEYTFIVEITEQITELPQGSLCVFRGGENRWREGDLVLVQRLSLPDHASYFIKRLPLENQSNCNGGSARLEQSGEEQPEPMRHGEVILGQFICVLV